MPLERGKIAKELVKIAKELIGTKPTKFIIIKKTRGGNRPYEGPACSRADVKPGRIYASLKEALEDAKKLSYVNPVGFKVLPYDGKTDYDSKYPEGITEKTKLARELISLTPMKRLPDDPKYFVSVNVVDPKEGWSQGLSRDYPYFHDEMLKLEKDKLIHAGMEPKYTYTWGFADKSEAQKFMDKLKMQRFVRKWKLPVKMM